MREHTDFLSTNPLRDNHPGSVRSLIPWIDLIGLCLFILAGVVQWFLALFGSDPGTPGAFRLALFIQGAITLFLGPMILHVLCKLALALLDIRDDTRAMRQQSAVNHAD